ncbi:MAG: chemotaxis protein CheW [Brevinema sp.]
MPVIVPFMVGDSWFGLPLDHVKGIESCGDISLIPNSQKPLVGLMHKHNNILPVWSVTPTVLDYQSPIQSRMYYIDVTYQDHQIAIPVDQVQSVTEVTHGWVGSDIAGLTVYKSLAKSLSIEVEENTPEIKKISSVAFLKDANLSAFSMEEI